MNRLWMVSLLLLSLFLDMGVSAADEPVTSSLKVKFYGKIKADASVDDSRTTPGTYVKWVDPEDNAYQASTSQMVKPKDDGKFNATAAETRFGFNLSGPKVGGADVSGKIEMDFYSGSANNKAQPFMRHAFGKMNWAEEDVYVIFGQTWDIVSPLNPTTLNYPVLWWCGNTGYRRAQLSYGQGFKMGEGKFNVQAGIFDNLGDSSFTNTTGGAADAPTLQARAAFTFPTWAPKPTTIGVSGHVGEMRDNVGTSTQRARTEAIYVDLSLPFAEKFALKAEAYHGRNMQQFLGGIGQGLNSNGSGAMADHEISSTGYWLAGSLGPWDVFSINIGAGIDNPNENDMTAPAAGAASSRIFNQCIFANFLFKLDQHLTLGFEISNWQTRYMNSTRSTHEAKANRIQASAIYSFY